MPSAVGVWEKNQFCAKKYAILNKFWYLFPILQQKVGGLSPSPESGGPIPCPPPAPTPMPDSPTYVCRVHWAYVENRGAW